MGRRRAGQARVLVGGLLITSTRPMLDLVPLLRASVSPTNSRNLVETSTGSYVRMANAPSPPVPIPRRVAFVWASHVRPIPTSIAHTTAKWEPYRPNFLDVRDCACEVSHDLISVECSFSMTLLYGWRPRAGKLSVRKGRP